MQNEDKLRACYDKLSARLEREGIKAEPWESVKLVEEYRQYWRPKNVRIILLAESHVYTPDEERKFKLYPRKDLPNYPQDYARFIYCLAHGDNHLISPHPADIDPPPNVAGAPQFWQLFYSCENYVNRNDPVAPIFQDGNPDNEERIQNKINLLNSLRERGIWLVDTSIMALYNKGKKPPYKTMIKALQTSWDKYTGQIVEEANSAHIIVIGTGVGNALRKRLPDNRTVIPAPGSRLPKKQFFNNWRKYYDLCQEHAFPN